MALSGTQSIILRSIEDVMAYISMWKAIAKDGIHYHDISTAPGLSASARKEGSLTGDPKFAAHRLHNGLADTELHMAELHAVETMRGSHPEAHQQYLDLQMRLTRHILRQGGGEAETGKLIGQMVQFLQLHGEAMEAVGDWDELLKKHGLLDDSPEARQSLARYILFRKLQFVEAASQVLLANTDLFESAVARNKKDSEFKKLAEMLVRDADLDLDGLLWIAPPAGAYAVLPPEVTPIEKTDYHAEYKSTIGEIKAVEEQLTEITLALRTTTRDSDREAYYASINTLREKKEMLGYVAEQQYKKIGTLNKATVSAKDWIGKNLFDKKKAGKDAAKVFFSTAGVAIGKLLWHKLSGSKKELDTDKIKQDILNGLIETGLTAVGTFFFGPMGGSFTKKMMTFFREEPADPFLVELHDLKKQLGEGLVKIETQLDKISNQVTQELNALSDKLEAHHELTARKQSFEAKKDETIRLLKKLSNLYTDIFVQRKTTVNAAALTALDGEIQEALVALVSILYHENYSLSEDIAVPSADSLCGRFIAYNQNMGVQFHTVAGSLLRICNEVVRLGERYLDLRRKWFSAMSATMVFYGGGSKESNQIFSTYWDAHRNSSEYASELMIELEMLKMNIVGANNLVLLQAIERALAGDRAQIDFLGGFGLEEALDGETSRATAALLAFRFSDETRGEGQFVRVTDRSFVPRYVVTGATFVSNAKSYYSVHTHQENKVPVPIQMHFRLKPNDTLEILNIATGKAQMARVLATTDTPAFAVSLEAFFAKGTTEALEKNLSHRFSLPVQSHFLSLGYDAQQAAVVVKVVHQTASEIKDLGTYTYAVPFKTEAELAQGTGLRFQLKPVVTAAAASLEITVMDLSQRRVGKVAVVVSDYAAMHKSGLARALKNVSTYLLKMPVHDGNKIVMTEVRTENLRPFVSNLMLSGDEFAYKSEERNHFGELVARHTGWRSLNGGITLQAFNPDAWFVQLGAFRNRENLGSVFNRYEYANSYSGKLIFQADGNFVMYDGKGKALAATDTRIDAEHASYAYLDDDGSLVVVDTHKKSATKREPVQKPETKVAGNWQRKDSNRLFVGTRMYEAYDYRIESENGEYYAEFWKDIVEEGGLFTSEVSEYSLLLRKQGGQIVKKMLVSGHLKLNGKGITTYLIMQGDGNLVSYWKERKVITPMAATGTNARENEGCVLCLTNDGKLFLAKTAERKIIHWLVQ